MIFSSKKVKVLCLGILIIALTLFYSVFLVLLLLSWIKPYLTNSAEPGWTSAEFSWIQLNLGFSWIWLNSTVFSWISYIQLNIAEISWVQLNSAKFSWFQLNYADFIASAGLPWRGWKVQQVLFLIGYHSSHNFWFSSFCWRKRIRIGSKMRLTAFKF